MPTLELINPLTRVRRRRKLKSSLFFALTISFLLIFQCPTGTHAFSATSSQPSLSERKAEWIERSVKYYSTIMRKKDTISSSTQSQKVSITGDNANAIYTEHDKEFVGLAIKLYYARNLIHDGRLEVAERLYRRIISDLTDEQSEHDCDHATLAVSTLLLALHMQRFGNIKETRSIFLDFFRRVALTENEELHKCSCSAKVLQAYALFEMKNGNAAKSLEIIQRAVKMDEKVRPVLRWKQFRDAADAAAAAGKTNKTVPSP
eukprot:CAMPEP_0196144106 /NCGR_PEP_ID=MMETSP0910-20130528/15099_1 /TAXON_ID=49265 /ORGANISM="Thalassiosira rotula, Strain GSO102" /LENGTH=260 /DNA_ID=CAMNT_0041405679 /DNA_START=189 /DNA_END=971 /DNA_ORIENTATION=-